MDSGETRVAAVGVSCEVCESPRVLIFFFFNDTATTEIYTLSLHDALPICMRKAKTDRQRKAAVARIGTYPPKFVELAEQFPNDPIALVALRQAVQSLCTTDSAAQITWETNRSDFPAGLDGSSAGKAVALVLRDHIKSEKLGPVCDRMRHGYRMEYARCLRSEEGR